MDKKTSFNAWYLMIAVLLMVVVQGLWQESQRTEYLPYSEFETYLKDGKIDELTITGAASAERSSSVQITRSSPSPLAGT
jgi:hypothetical protein